ncbi:MAG TPA: geranylgeranylglyceryl/heptaprenylglyceryl phosphate synthase [Ignavibacteriaceae bacterium]|nr:geranylgeranylglyceryl/heptaprenylglyceryl phosphate synthase [Ignavibacteriaceae bacterium]
MKIYNHLESRIDKFGAAYLVLIDPDNLPQEKIPEFLAKCDEAEVDGLLLGGSLILHEEFSKYVKSIKMQPTLPIILFPGSINQISRDADALLYISLISGRNPEHLIGQHVIAAPMIKKYNIETISTGYMLIESGTQTTAQYISGSFPIPSDKPSIAVATALAAQYMGMKLVYLEAGSGAKNHVPFEMVKAVSSMVDIPIVVGGGIRNPQTASKLVANGAKLIVTGNHFENENHWEHLKLFADAVHVKKSILI